MVLADAEEVDAELVSQLGFLDDVAEDARLPQESALGVGGNVTEGIQA
jgi:hypothetical protein